jgi:glutamate-ammonia-ligase adenylyltransferase
LGEFLDRLIESSPETAAADLPKETSERVEKLARTSRIYSQLLLQNPGWIQWLELSATRPGGLDFYATNAEWERYRLENNCPERTDAEYLPILRRFRRRISLRIAYQSLAGLTAESSTVRELTQLAEFCVRECYFISLEKWTSLLGQPWDDAENEPARFCCVALGKLGGGELNFSSDVDLLYLYEGEGNTRIAGKRTSTANNEFFHRLGESITRSLNQRDATGFLFRTDLRLRPGGDGSPLVPSLEAMENYYAVAGQTWERLALLKARPIAGDFSLGGELLESLQSFRYPRHPPPSILADVASMKIRTENEVVGSDAVSRDVKSGYGGIREIEFVVQASQLLHGARFPFLQTTSTIEGLHQLVRYKLLSADTATRLESAYWFLRRVEHRLQIVDEHQTHELPAGDGARMVIASSMGFGSLENFDSRSRESAGRSANATNTRSIQRSFLIPTRRRNGGGFSRTERVLRRSTKNSGSGFVTSRIPINI